MTSMVIFALTEPEERGVNYFLYGMSDKIKVQEIFIMSVNNIPATSLRKKIQQGNYYILQHFSLNQKDEVNYVRITSDRSKVFQTGVKFDIPKEDLQEFYNPRICTIPQALASPKKRKLSVEGTIVEVYPMKEGNNWKRKDILLEDPSTSKKICCKLWNKYADSIAEDSKGSTITLTNVEVDVYNDRHQLRSIAMTKVTLATPKTSQMYHVIGVDPEDFIHRNFLTIITDNGKTFQLQEDKLRELEMSAADFTAITPTDVMLETQGDKIIKIELPKK